MDVTVETKTHYGTTHIYVTSENGTAIRALTGKKTLSGTDISALKALGFNIVDETTSAITRNVRQV